jgi:hypothetical protein
MKGAASNQFQSDELSIRCRKPCAVTIFNEKNTLRVVQKAAVNVITKLLVSSLTLTVPVT